MQMPLLLCWPDEKGKLELKLNKKELKISIIFSLPVPPAKGFTGEKEKKYEAFTSS